MAEIRGVAARRRGVRIGEFDGLVAVRFVKSQTAAKIGQLKMRLLVSI